MSTEVDTRLGFFGYGVVTVTWQHPQCNKVLHMLSSVLKNHIHIYTASVHIDHYVVKMFSLSGDRKKYSSDHLLRVRYFVIIRHLNVKYDLAFLQYYMYLLQDTTSLTMKAEVKNSLFWLGNRYDIEVKQKSIQTVDEIVINYINRCVQSLREMRSAQREISDYQQV